MAEHAATMPHVDSHSLAVLQAIGSLAGTKTVYEYSVLEQREVFSKMQSERPKNPGVSISKLRIKTSLAPDFESFLFDLVMRTGLAIVFLEYTLAPEKKHPTQIEQCIEVTQHVIQHGSVMGLKVDRFAIGADSAGCQMAAAISILNRQRSLRLPTIDQVLFHPVIDTTSRIDSGIFWGPEWMERQRSAYFSTVEERSKIIGSPGLMIPDEAKMYMPPTTMISPQHDAFRAEDEAFAKLLQTAGVACGHLQAFASLHAVQLFNQSRTSPTAEMIMAAVAGILKNVLGH